MKQNRRILVPHSWLIAVVVLFFVARFPYRILVRASEIKDWGLAGVLPSFFFALALLLFGARWRSDRPALFMFCLFPVIYEATQFDFVRDVAPWLVPTQRAFDVADVIASLIGSGCALLLIRRVEGEGQHQQHSPNKTMEPTR